MSSLSKACSGLVFGHFHPMNLSRQYGFSLVELLVVMFIGALLAGLVTPVLGRARQAGEKAAETSAAKNLITAYLAATQDQEGVLLKVLLV